MSHNWRLSDKTYKNSSLPCAVNSCCVKSYDLFLLLVLLWLMHWEGLWYWNKEQQWLGKIISVEVRAEVSTIFLFVLFLYFFSVLLSSFSSSLLIPQSIHDYRMSRTYSSFNVGSVLTALYLLISTFTSTPQEVIWIVYTRVYSGYASVL